MAKKTVKKKGAKKGTTKKQSVGKAKKKTPKTSQQRKGSKKGAEKTAATKAGKRPSKKAAKKAARRMPRKGMRMAPTTIAPTPEAGAAAAGQWSAGGGEGGEGGMGEGGDEEGSRRRGAHTSSESKQRSVGAYISSLPRRQRAIAERLRAFLREAAPHARESIKWGQPVYEVNGPFAYIKAHRNYVNLGFWRGIDLVDPKGLLEGEGNKMRHVKISAPEEIDRESLLQFVRAAVALNEQKGDPTKGDRQRRSSDSADARAAAAVGLSEVIG